MMKQLRGSIVAAAWLTGLALQAAETNAPERVRVDGIAAYVNEHVITMADVMVLVEPVRRQLLATYTGEAYRERLQEAYDNTLGSLIDRFLVLDAYEAQQGRIPEWVVNQRAEEMIEDMFKGDRDALMAALAREQMTYEEWYENIRKHIIMQSMRNASVDQHIHISPGTVRTYYDGHGDEFQEPAKVRVSMIVVTEEQAADVRQRRAMAADVVKQLREGDSFAVLARRLSGGSHAEDGGDWGWIEPARDLRSELAQQIAALETGQLADPIRIGDDYYIIRVAGRREAATASFDSVQAEIERKLRREESRRSYDAWIARLKADAFVKIMDVDLF